MMKKYRVKISNFVFGVPPTFIGRQYTAEQFILIGTSGGDLGKSIGIGANLTDDAFLELKKKTKSHIGTSDLMYVERSGKLNNPFSRVLIKLRFR